MKSKDASGRPGLAMRCGRSFERLPFRSKLGLVSFGLFATYLLTYNFLSLPSNRQLVELGRQFYLTNGPVVTFAAAFLEAMLIVGEYVPGSTVVLLGAVYASEGIVDIRLVAIGAICGFLGAYFIDFWVGRTGLYNRLAKSRLQPRIEQGSLKFAGVAPRRRRLLSLLMYFDPNIAAVFAVTSGVLRVKFPEFAQVAVVGTILWNCFWAALVFHFGSVVITVLETWLIVPVILVFFACTIVDLGAMRKALRRRARPSSCDADSSSEPSRISRS